MKPADQHLHRHEQAHGHPQDRGFAHRRMCRVLRPHRHDSVDRLDHALETSKGGLRALVWSFAALLGTALVQLALVVVTGSVALLADTIHNFADALTAVPLGIAFLLGRRVATRRYTYGLGRVEDLAGVVVVLIIAGSAALAGYQAISRMIRPAPVEHLWVVAGAGLIGFVGNELVARWRINVGRRIGSAALVADGLHARTDGFTSLAVVGGALGLALGFPLADPIIGLVMTAVILYVLRDAAVAVLRRLLDAVDPADVARAERAAQTVPGVLCAGQPRMRWVGHSLRAELAVTVDAALTVEQAHHIAHQVEHKLAHAVPRLIAAVVHTEPATGAQAAHQLVEHHR
jgi:cation diffusion facilitator family transporter